MPIHFRQRNNWWKIMLFPYFSALVRKFITYTNGHIGLTILPTIKVLYLDMKPIVAHRVSIGAFCDKTPDVPVGMTGQVPETSRFLDALEKKYREDHQLMANALSFGEYGKAGGQNV